MQVPLSHCNAVEAAAVAGCPKTAMLKLHMLSAAVLAGVFLTASLSAAHSQDRQVVRQACSADYQKLCADVRLGGGRALQCLHAHDKELAPECKAALDAYESPPPTGTASQ